MQLNPQVKQGGYHITCASQSDGVVQALAIGGTPPYSYNWSDGSTQANRSGLSAGTYILTVTDSLLAQVTDSVKLFQPQLLSATSQKSNFHGNYAVSQYGGNDGSIQALVNGGVPPYNYNWSSGSTQAIISAIGAETYSCTVTDAAGCITNINETLNQPGQLQASISDIQHLSCNGFNDGSARAMAWGGVGPYSYRWNSGESDSIAYNLRGGIQNLDIADRHGATLRISFEILEPDPLAVSTSVSSFPNGFNVSCSGCFNGSITLTASGGTAPYYIMWMDSSDSFSRSQLGGGKHNYMVSDDKGCKITDFTMLKEPERDDWSRSGNSNVDPNSQFIGTVDFTPIAFKTNGQEVLRIAEDGNVGIGTSAPEYKFDVDGNVRLKQGVKLAALPNISQSLTYEQESTYKSIVLGPNGDLFAADFPVATPINNQGECKATMDGNQIISWKSIAANPGILYAGADEACKPNVGIGTNNPLETFHVIGNTINEGNLNSHSAIIGNFYNSPPSNSLLYIPSINMGGSGQASLEIDHNTLVGAEFTYSFINKVDKNSTKAIAVQQSKDNIEPFIVYVDGTTIIGHDPLNPITPDSDTKLAVHGLISAHEVLVKVEDFPDYVFEDDYCLEKLEAVSEYVNTNKHLPGVKSAKELIAGGGMEIGEMQVIAFEKIEELYLHVIQLNERLKVLEEENKRLRNK